MRGSRERNADTSACAHRYQSAGSQPLRTTKDFKLSFAPSAITISDAGDLAVERGTYQASFAGPKGKKIEDHGNYVTVYRKLNGQWKVMADINSSEVPGAM